MTTKQQYKAIGIITFLTTVQQPLQAKPDFDVSIHGNATGGITDGSHSRTAIHAHDPNKDYNLQGLELGLNVRANDYIEGFLNANTFLTADDKLDSEWEEAFAKVKDLSILNVPGKFEARAGMFLNRIGTENNVHLHGWEYVNANLSTGMFLGEEGLSTEGAEVSWLKDLTSGNFIVSGSYGKAREHEHDHGHEEEHEEHEGEEHEGEEHEEHEEENESRELAYFNDNLVSLRAQLLHNQTDFFKHRMGVSMAQGQNGYGRDTRLLGADYTHTWREKGLEVGGKEISSGVEYFNRNVEWQDEMDLGNTGQQSLALKTSYAWNEHWRLGARYEWIEGVSGDAFYMEQYQRTSLALTYTHSFNEDWTSVTRLQLNHDKVGNDRSNNAYLQLGFSYGGGEIR